MYIRRNHEISEMNCIYDYPKQYISTVLVQVRNVIQ